MKKYTYGWNLDIPDHRDLTYKSDMIEKKNDFPTSIDLRKFCSYVEDQEDLPSCVAHAVGGLLEVYINKKNPEKINLSKLFLYKATKNLTHTEGKEPLRIRDTIKAAKIFGVPPEEYWIYDTSRFDEEPPSFVYSIADDYTLINYFKLDIKKSGNKLLENIKEFLSREIPIALGYPVYDSFRNIGDIPFPEKSDGKPLGHAVMIVGYDDNKIIEHPQSKKTYKGALLFKNSFGENWGEKGYGWLSYEYVRQELVKDCWAITSANYFDNSQE